MINWKIEYSEVYVYICIYTVKYGIRVFEFMWKLDVWFFDQMCEIRDFYFYFFFLFFSQSLLIDFSLFFSVEKISSFEGKINFHWEIGQLIVSSRLKIIIDVFLDTMLVSINQIVTRFGRLVTLYQFVISQWCCTDDDARYYFCIIEMSTRRAGNFNFSSNNLSLYYLLHIDHVLTISSIFLFLLFSSLAKLSIFIHKIQLENLNSFRGFLSKGPIPDPRPQSP